MKVYWIMCEILPSSIISDMIYLLLALLIENVNVLWISFLMYCIYIYTTYLVYGIYTIYIDVVRCVAVPFIL